MSELEEQDFIKDYMTWMKGPRVQFESLHIYNFGYQRNLPLPSIALSPDSKLRFNLQRSGMQTPSRRSIVIIGDGYLGRYQEIMLIVDRIQEDSQALPFAIFVQTEEEVRLENISSHMMPASLVGKYIKQIKHIRKKPISAELQNADKLMIQFRFISRTESPVTVLCSR